MDNNREMGVRSQKSEVKKSKQYAVGSRQKHETTNRRPAYCLLLTAYCCFLLTVLPGCGQKTEEDGIRKTLPKEGDDAPLFSLKLLDDGEFRLADVKGKPVVLNFWASWCHPCRIEAPVLQRVYAQYKDKGVIFIGIAIQDTEAKARGYIKEFSITFPNGLDTTGHIGEAYKMYGIPKTFIIGKDGKFSYIHVGEITEPDLVREIEKVVR